MKTKPLTGLLLIMVMICTGSGPEMNDKKWPENIQVILENTTALTYKRGDRLPLYLWPAIDPGKLTDTEAEMLVRELDSRGIGLISRWKAGEKESSLETSLVIARAQTKLGQRVNIEATSLMDSFFNGDIKTAHIDDNGNPFFDDSFGDHKMGCPFALDFRKKEIRARFEYFTEKFRKEGLKVDFIFTDWEIDGPLEVNRAFAASKKCKRCRQHLGEDFSFTEFQKAMREMRSYFQNYACSSVILSRFPDALVGNYAVYPNDGYRYWYDYFEYYVDGQPFIADQNAKYRKWFNDFPLTGYTFAMPVVYTWDQIFGWYDFENTDYRWFYNMLKVAGNAGKSTPQGIPVISFVHWNTVKVASMKPEPVQMSLECYKELLWHMLLRGTDTFFMWCNRSEYAEEIRPVHEVYSAAQQYGRFLEKGIPITFDVPAEPGTVISGLVLGDSVLIRRTDFGSNREPVSVLAGTKTITVGFNPGKCVITPMN